MHCYSRSLVTPHQFSAVSDPNWNTGPSGLTDPAKNSQKKGENELSCSKSPSLGWRLRLEPECLLSGFKKSYCYYVV
jgi:hypothetical protein